VVDADPEVIRLDKEKDPFVMIVPIALTSIVIIIVAIACRHFKNKNQANLMDA
tara:strand:+ start:332 stop:490 length:159 start_codon:yes stop_codon:yes gene_type:complete